MLATSSAIRDDEMAQWLRAMERRWVVGERWYSRQERRLKEEKVRE